jgi:hypothetical protein
MKERILNIGLKIWSKVPQQFKELLYKFYLNKKPFWAVMISIGLILLILVIGLVFGNRNKNVSTTKNIPTPTPQNQTIQTNKDLDVLSKIELDLNKLKNQIESFDINQSRLKSPPLNFDIAF